ncbi:lipoprotein-anchoring transpeptidase ErfK/SrfK [Paenibacillus sacheonensis]|nr:lipoprotein-anchoring transpeptidase ErfK/SrfK [Paenibacillus sacheonensis]
MALIMAVAGGPGRSSAQEAQEANEAYISVAYSIKPGETLYSISKKFYLTGDYERVAKTNGWNPMVGLKSGTSLTLRNPLLLDQYTVKTGDTLYAVTNRYFNRTRYMDALMDYNGISDPNTGLKAGAALRVPLPAGELRYTVLKGDTLFSLAARYFKAADYQGAIAQSNGIKDAAGSIKAGQTLQIPNPYYADEAVSSAPSTPNAPSTPSIPSNGAAVPIGPVIVLSIEIDLGNNTLNVLRGGKALKSFGIASGRKAGLTPTGSYEIITKIKNPWYSAKGIPGGDPSNPLGSRWLGLSVPNTQGTKYGIHGTNAPSSIGSYASGGCIRMNNKDVEWLYDTIPTGTKVRIHA